MTKIELIVEKFKEANGLQSDFCWQNKPGKKTVSDLRERLVATVMLYYQPEKLTGEIKNKSKYGINKTLSLLMPCHEMIISQTLSKIIVSYRHYKGFREQVHLDYDNIRQYL